MATFKICTQGHTTWLTDVERVDEVRAFTRKEGDGPLEAAYPNDTHTPEIYLTDFAEHERDGKVVRVYQRGMLPRLWVVPYGSAFLMSESGETIDKI